MHFCLWKSILYNSFYFGLSIACLECVIEAIKVSGFFKVPKMSKMLSVFKRKSCLISERTF